MENKSGTNVDSTIDYYNNNAKEFISSTANVDMSVLYAAFQKYLCPGSRILDLGSGSGRDSKHFIDKGYDVLAIDPSEEMRASTKKLAGITPIRMKAEELNITGEFDAIWACASLLHVSSVDMENVLRRCLRALKDEGYMYASWKFGCGERVIYGRRYTDYTEESLEDILNRIEDLKVVTMWKSEDVRIDSTTVWINVIVQKRAESR